MSEASLVTVGVREGGCLCGEIRYRAGGEPIDPHVCSCDHCKRLGGAPMMAWVNFTLAVFAWVAGADWVVREPAWDHTYPTSKRGRCPRCGTQLCALDDDADSIAMTIFSLDRHDDPVLVPRGQSFRPDAVSWLPQIPNGGPA